MDIIALKEEGKEGNGKLQFFYKKKIPYFYKQKNLFVC